MLTLSQVDEIEVISGFHSDGFHDQFVLLVCVNRTLPFKSVFRNERAKPTALG